MKLELPTISATISGCKYHGIFVLDVANIPKQFQAKGSPWRGFSYKFLVLKQDIAEEEDEGVRSRNFKGGGGGGGGVQWQFGCYPNCHWLAKR